MPSADGEKTADEPGLFQCGSCKRLYKRVDHLTRHIRSHTQFKPHQCHICLKKFTRTDLLKRHVAEHNAQSQKTQNQLHNNGGTGAPSRVSKACQICAANHLRCTNQKPCRRCTSKGIECIWNHSWDAAESPPSTNFGPSYSSTSASHPATSQGDDSEISDPCRETENCTQMDGLTPPESSFPPTISEFSQQPNTEIRTGFSTPKFPELSLLSRQWSALDEYQFDLASSMEFDDLDLRFLDEYNIHVPFEQGNVSQPAIGGTSPVESPRSAHPAAVRNEPPQNSLWRFIPSARDHGAAEEHNLSLPTENVDHASPESRVSVSKRVTPATLGTAARDQVLTIVVNSCRPENLPRAIASFPSVGLLDALLQFYLSSSVARADSFIHAATFDPNEKRPELLLAMFAAGGVLTSDPALSKLGYAMQESVRASIPRLWERDNTSTRDLQLIQAYLIILEIGLWSGHSRKAEIAESFLQPLLTMLRRGGKLRNSSYPQFAADSLSESETLKGTWQAWLHHESFKRTAFRVIQHDTNASMGLSVNPLISYTEISLPLPCSPLSWMASNAEQWKAAVIAGGGFTSQTIADCLDDPEAFDSYSNQTDVTIASLAFLSCIWSLAWEHIQLSSLQRSKPRRWNTLLLSSRLDEILKLINHFRISMGFYTSHMSDVTMRLEMICLHLHMPFENVQTFIGMDGPGPARAIYPVILEWASTEAARKAVWHAGQITRLAKTLPKTMVQGPAAIMVYHASLAMWVYALISRDSATHQSGFARSQHIPGDQSQVVWLDESDSMAVQRFLQFGSGRPFIRGSMVTGDQTMIPIEAPLTDPDKVMEAVIEVLHANHLGLPKLHLIEKLVKLMQELQRSVQQGARPGIEAS